MRLFYLIPCVLFLYCFTSNCQSVNLNDGKANSNKIPYGNNPEAGNYFISGDTKLYYEVYGEGDPILMLHGGVYGYIDEFEYLIPLLAEKHQVICLATRGHGKSEIGKEPFTFEQRAKDAYNLLQHLKIQKTIVIGFSDGGATSYKLAAIYPQIVTKIIVMGAGDMKVGKREKSQYSEEILMKESGGYFEGRKKMMPEPKRWGESLKMLNNLYNNDLISVETFSKVKCPALLVAGDSDQHASVESVVNAFRQIPNAKLSIIPNCGHVVFYCNFPAVWESMKGFIEGKK